jgi:hypothetical protein
MTAFSSMALCFHKSVRTIEVDGKLVISVEDLIAAGVIFIE